MGKNRKKVKSEIVETKTPVKTKVRTHKPWTTAKIQQFRPAVIIPSGIWQILCNLSQSSSTEYSALLEIEEVSPNTYRIMDWYLPYQTVSSGSVGLNELTGPNMVRDIGDRFENFYGVYHLHPWKSKTGPNMSTTDVEEMWTWVANAGRGIFIVADPMGRASTIYVGKQGELRYQVEMDLIIDYQLPPDSVTALAALKEQRLRRYVYKKKKADDDYDEFNIEDYKRLLLAANKILDGTFFDDGDYYELE